MAMFKSVGNLLIPMILIINSIGMWTSTRADITSLNYSCFVVKHKITLPGSPVMIYDAITGEISGWWDHSFSDSPLQFYIEPKPGGGFYEIFDESGDGVLHATVIVAQRGKLLRFDGPLGLSGRAIKMVHTYEFSPVGSDSTLLKLSVNISGEIDEGLPETIDQVWHHFLFGRFKPYVEENRHLLVSFKEDEKWGYKNNEGRVIIQPTYHLAGQFTKYGLAAVVDDSGWVYISMNGIRILKPYIIDNGPDYFSEGLARFINRGKIGFMDEGGTIVISANFEFAMPFSEGLAAYCVGCKPVSHDEYHHMGGGKWGYINKTGKIMLNPEYDRAGSFKDGQAAVFKGEKKLIIWKKDLRE